MTMLDEATSAPAVGIPLDRHVMRGATVAPKRPLVRYHGGKWKLGAWIIRHLPAHRTYVEPFGGGGSVLLQKQRSYAEVYNDLDGEIVNLFLVARDHGEALASACELTPFARDEFDRAYEPAGDPLEQARRTLVRSFMGFGRAGISGLVTGFRSSVTRNYTTPASDWMNYPAHLRAVVQRLRQMVMADHRRLAHDKTADALTTRYLAALATDWMSVVHTDVAHFRREIGLEPKTAFSAMTSPENAARLNRLAQGQPIYADGPLPERGWD